MKEKTLNCWRRGRVRVERKMRLEKEVGRTSRKVKFICFEQIFSCQKRELAKGIYRLEELCRIILPSLSPFDKLFFVNKAESTVFRIWTTGWHCCFFLCVGFLVTGTQLGSLEYKSITNMTTYVVVALQPSRYQQIIAQSCNQGIIDEIILPIGYRIIGG